MFRSGFLLALMGVAFFLLGCPKYERVCTEIGCSDGYSLTLKHSTWVAGTYRFDIEIDSEKYACNVTLPFASCNVPEPCNSNRVSLGLSGCALPSNQHSISGVTTRAVDFSQFKLKISLSNTVLLDQSFHPTFQTSQPNGPGCEPICRNASDTVQF